MKLTYEEFAEFLGRYIESEKKFNNFAQAVEEYFTDTYIMAPKDSELVLDILRTVMGDDEDWIIVQKKYYKDGKCIQGDVQYTYQKPCC